MDKLSSQISTFSPFSFSFLVSLLQLLLLVLLLMVESGRFCPNRPKIASQA
jgi:hypothetical protein